MPRRKGSRNKAAASVDERIAVVTEEIASLQEQIKEKKAELKKLTAEKEEEDQKRILDAVAESGKSVDEIIALIRESTQNTVKDY